ncbi:MAG: hydrogenase maturation protease [Deltaproteobacteria bacterium]|nr:hydrogenase maturation protease [Deltaproteobacteria bacterium]
MNRIVCIGNRFLEQDSAGPRVFDRLRRAGAVPDVEICDGGTAGLNLLSAAEGCKRVVFVDAVQGFGAPGDLVVLEARDFAEPSRPPSCHGMGLSTLIPLFPKVCDRPAPEVYVLGIESPADEDAIQRAAERSLALARHGRAVPGAGAPREGGVLS